MSVSSRERERERMGRTPSFDKNGRKKGSWSPEEDDKLRAYVQRYGHWNWRELPKYAGRGSLSLSLSLIRSDNGKEHDLS